MKKRSDIQSSDNYMNKHTFDTSNSPVPDAGVYCCRKTNILMLALEMQYSNN